MTKTQSRTRNRKSGTSRSAAEEPVSTEVTRRRLLGRLGYGALGVVVFGGAGLWGARHVQAINAEHDLSRLGQGIPVVVQVHDPKCPVCQSLQRQARKALRAFGEDEILYLVANIRTPDGDRFAARHGVPHVTLLLFDGQGNLHDILQGPREADALRPAFERLIRPG